MSSWTPCSASGSRDARSDMSLLDRLGLNRPELRAWAMYDWADSAFQSTVITAVFPPFFSSFAAAGLPVEIATARFAWATTVAVTITAILGPILGGFLLSYGGTARHVFWAAAIPALIATMGAAAAASFKKKET